MALNIMLPESVKYKYSWVQYNPRFCILTKISITNEYGMVYSNF